MTALRAPGLGPVIGHTTHDSCRLWIQAADLADQTHAMVANRRTVGVIGLLTPDGSKVTRAYYFRLHREFDRTGTFVMGKDVALGRHESDNIPKAKRDNPVKLAANTKYKIRMATLTIDDPLTEDESVSDVMLTSHLPDIEKIGPMLLELRPEDCEVEFRTFPAPGASHDELSFLLGSCRYPGLMWKIKESDRIFGPMRDHLVAANGQPAARFTLMVGDQIYADMLNRFVPIGLADTYQEFQERYRAAFGSLNMQQLLRAAPTYMILDDHEIEDNWTQDRIRKDAKHRLFNLAIGAYMSYQWSHGPRSFGNQLYYNFECSGYPFFALDTRTQRYKDDEAGLEDNHLLGRPAIDPAHPGQLAVFLDWLRIQQKEHGNVPKFVLSSSVFAPNSIRERLHEDGMSGPSALMTANLKRRADSDSWPAYPNTRKAIIEHLVQNTIQNVVFLTGDIHCSNIARLEFVAGGKDLGLVAYDVTSSALYWPFPFADGNPNDYVHNSTAAGQVDPFPFDGGDMHYRAWGFAQQDNFARIDIDKVGAEIRVHYFDRDGDPVTVMDDRGRKARMNRLPLAPWA